MNIKILIFLQRLYDHQKHLYLRHLYLNKNIKSSISPSKYTTFIELDMYSLKLRSISKGTTNLN